MTIRELARLLGVEHRQGPTPHAIGELTDDSREVAALRQRIQAPPHPDAGVLFVARDTGDPRWRQRVDQAVAAGAAAVLAPQPIELPDRVALLVSPRVDQELAGRAAAAVFGHPTRRLRLLGVTGTNGKTTVATLTQHLLRRAGVKCGLLGTVAVDEGHPHGPRPAELTTPGAIALQRHFAAMAAHGCSACAMEVSSHALDQGRVAGLTFAAAVFTNLTQDHLDYHGTMAAYAAAKARLFAALAPDASAVVNLDSPHWRDMHPPAGRTLGTTTRPPADPTDANSTPEPGSTFAGVWWAHILELTTASAVIEARPLDAHGRPRPSEARRLTLPVVGRHNVANALQAAVAAAAILDAPVPDMLAALADVPPVPGRLQAIPSDSQAPGDPRPAVVVDYAHTPDALENVLHALRPLTPGRLVVVFGCGGDRDRTKRPRMAAAAVALSDHAWLTSDNPRTEDPQQILDDASNPLDPDQRSRLTVQIDRATAIAHAVAAARPGDTVLIAGKGHEDYQIVADPTSPTATRKLHFDDREHAAAALARWSPHPPDQTSQHPADPPPPQPADP